MYKPTKKTLYILIACVLSLTAIIIAKGQTASISKLIALDTSTNESINITDDSNSQLDETAKTQEVSTDYVTDGGANLTEDFSKGLFAKYYTANNGSELSSEDSQALVDQALESYRSINLGNTSFFALQDLKIVKSSDQNLRDFSNVFATKEETCIGELQKVAKTTEDPLKTGTLYKKCAVELSQIPITQEMNEAYLTILNSYYKMGEKLISLDSSKADPLKALVLIKDFSTIDNERVDAYKNISDLIKKSGIIFNNNEPGSAWVGDAQ
jgi:hypothetical protein